MLTALASPDIYRALLDSMSEGVSLTDAEGTIIYTNPAEDSLFGYGPGELLGQHVSVQNAYPDDENRRRMDDVIAVLKKQGFWHGEWLNRRKDGTVFRTSARITAVDIEGRQHWLCVQRDVTAERAAEQRLKESEERLRLAAEAAAIGTWDLDLRTGRGRWDETAVAIGGMDSAEFTAATWIETVHPDDRVRVMKAYEASLAHKGPAYHVEFRGSVPAPDGGDRWLSSHGAVSRDLHSGAPLRAIGIMRDITAEKAVLSALEDSEARFRALVDSVPSFVWFANSDGELEYFNDRWYEYTGQTPAEALPSGWTATLHPDDAEQTQREWEEARQRGVSYRNECRYRRRDGAYRWHVAQAEPVRDDKGQIVRWFGTSTDIHEQMQAVERLEMALDAGAIQGTWVWDVPADIVSSDERFAWTFGIDPVAARSGFPIQLAIDAIHPEDRSLVETSINQAIAEGGGYRCEYRVRNGEGEYRWVEASGKVELAADGTPFRFPGVAVDIEARRRAEEREHLLAREVDHRAKNLLGVIQSVVQLTRADDVADLKAAIAGRIQALARAHSLLAAGRWEGVELDSLIREELAPFQRPGTGRIRIAGEPLRLRPAASQALAIAIHELVTNAAKYGALSTDRGSVDIRWRECTPDGGKPRLELEWQESDGPLIIASPSHRGFGSTVIRSSIERQLGGTLDLDWRRDGLRCRMIIPAEQLVAASAAIADEPGTLTVTSRTVPMAGRRVLVLEDEALIALQIESILEELGAAVVGPVATVTEAVALLQDAKPDAAILDVNLAGERSDAVADACAALGVPFLFCTGYPDGLYSPQPEREVAYVTKPVEPALLSLQLSKVMGSMATRASAH